jgi:release factor glutamine methyltransferase
VTLQELILAAKPRLAHVETDDVMRDLRILAAHALGVERGRLTLHLYDAVSEAVCARFDGFVTQRSAQMPVSKIVGFRQFWGRDFYVNAHVLDPRGDTETLIAAALALGARRRVLDLGTGSGAIGLTLAAEWPGAEVICTDLSRDALEVAGRNAAQLGVAERVSLIWSDWFDAVTGRFDLIASNPPYIAEREMAGLDAEVRVHDPRMALTDESDGLEAYRVIAGQAARFLDPGGHVQVEIGAGQGAAVTALFAGAGFAEVRVLQDLAGRDRCVVCRAA